MSNQIPSEEWDFSNVPDTEIRACCIYEYAREAEYALWEAAVRHNEESNKSPSDAVRDGDGFLVDPDEPGNQDQQFSLEALLPPSPNFQAFLGNWAAWGTPYVIPPPWLLLPREQKAALDPITRSIENRSPVPVPILPISGAEWHELGDGFPDDCLYLCPGHRWGRGVIVGLKLFLEDYTDEEILAEFRKTLGLLRNRHLADGPGKSGKKVSAWRTRLDNLGIMRLRHSLERQEVVELLKGHRLKFWGDDEQAENSRRETAAGKSDKIGIPEIMNKADRRREVALEYFRSLFPQLGENAMPQNYETYMSILGR